MLVKVDVVLPQGLKYLQNEVISCDVGSKEKGEGWSCGVGCGVVCGTGPGHPIPTNLDQLAGM